MSLNGTNNKGYLRAHVEVKNLFESMASSAQQKAKGPLQSAFSGAATHSNSFFPGQQPVEKATNDISLMDVSPVAAKMTVPEVQTEKPIDTAKAFEGKLESTQPERQNVKQARDAYMKEDQAFTNHVVDAMHEADPEMANKVVGLMAKGQSGSNAGQFLAVAFDATVKMEPAGSIYAALTTLKGQIGKKDYEVFMDKTLGILHTQQREAEKKYQESKGNSPPPRFDVSKFKTGKDLDQFMFRDRSKDPFIQALDQADRNIDVKDENRVKMDPKGGEYFKLVTPEKIESAARTNNTEYMRALTGSADNMALAKAPGGIKIIMDNINAGGEAVKSYEDIAGNRGAVNGVSGLKVKLMDIADIGSGAGSVSKALAPVLEIPPPKISPTLADISFKAA